MIDRCRHHPFSCSMFGKGTNIFRVKDAAWKTWFIVYHFLWVNDFSIGLQPFAGGGMGDGTLEEGCLDVCFRRGVQAEIRWKRWLDLAGGDSRVGPRYSTKKPGPKNRKTMKNRQWNMNIWEYPCIYLYLYLNLYLYPIWIWFVSNDYFVLYHACFGTW